MRLSLTLADSQQNSGQPRDREASLDATRAWQAAIVRRVTQLNLENAFAQAGVYIEEQLAYFRRYCHGLPEAADLLAQLEQVAGVAGRRWNARTSKEINLSMHRQEYGARESRATPRPHWSTRLANEQDSEDGGAPQR